METREVLSFRRNTRWSGIRDLRAGSGREAKSYQLLELVATRGYSPPAILHTLPPGVCPFPSCSERSSEFITAASRCALIDLVRICRLTVTSGDAAKTSSLRWILSAPVFCVEIDC